MSLPSLTAAAYGAAAGLGLWASLGSIDRMQAPAGSVRVAMLPTFGTLALCVVAGAVLFALLHATLAALTRRAATGTTPPAAHALAPFQVLAGSAVLVLPYLPWVADAFPALMLLAGPGSRIAWGVLVALAVWAFAIERRAGGHVAAGLVPRSGDGTHAAAMTAGEALARRRRWTTTILLASLLSSAALAQQFMRTPLFPGGDEPHYLVISQSLWRDGDLRIENNHTRGDYQEYFHRPLAPHYLTRGLDRQIYSIHPIGMPVLMTPVYAAGGYELVVYALLLLAAIAMTSAWRLAWAVTGSASAATFAWAVLALGPPWIFNTFAVYPEIPAACACALAFAWTTGWHAERDAHRHPLDVPVWRWWATGVAIGTLPWFSTKYLVMAAVLGLVSLLRAWLPWPADTMARRRAIVRTLAVSVPNVISLAMWLLFFKVIWGSWSPAAPYGSQRATRLAYLPEGGPGLLFDQEYGIVVFAPALLMVLPGLWALWRQRGARRRLAIEIVAVFAGLMGVVGSFHIWWGGSATVGRPLVSALPLLVLPIAAHWTACATQPLRRAAQHVLLCVGTALTVLLASAQDGLLLVAGRDGTSQVLEYLAPSTPVWTVLPTFLRQSPAQAWLLCCCGVARRCWQDGWPAAGAPPPPPAAPRRLVAGGRHRRVGLGPRRPHADGEHASASARRARASPPPRRVRRGATSTRYPLRSADASRSRPTCRSFFPWSCTPLATGARTAPPSCSAADSRCRPGRTAWTSCFLRRRPGAVPRNPSKAAWPFMPDAPAPRSRTGPWRSRRPGRGDARSRSPWTSGSSDSRRRRQLPRPPRGSVSRRSASSTSAPGRGRPPCSGARRTPASRYSSTAKAPGQSPRACGCGEGRPSC